MFSLIILLIFFNILLLTSYYNSRLSDKSKEKTCIEFTQENSIEFLV